MSTVRFLAFSILLFSPFPPSFFACRLVFSLVFSLSKVLFHLSFVFCVFPFFSLPFFPTFCLGRFYSTFNDNSGSMNGYTLNPSQKTQEPKCFHSKYCLPCLFSFMDSSVTMTTIELYFPLFHPTFVFFYFLFLFTGFSLTTRTRRSKSKHFNFFSHYML